MKLFRSLLAMTILCALGQASYAQNIEGQIIASQFGSYLVPGIADVFVSLPSTTAFAINSGTTPLVANTLHTWGYTCTQ
jgi:hypothetical protein